MSLFLSLVRPPLKVSNVQEKYNMSHMRILTLSTGPINKSEKKERKLILIIFNPSYLKDFLFNVDSILMSYFSFFFLH